MQMHMCAPLIPQLVMRAHRGRTMFGISSLFSEYINSTQPISENRIFFSRPPATMCRVAPGARRVLVCSSSSIDYTRFILFMISFLSCRRPSLLFRIYLIRRHRPCIRAPKIAKKRNARTNPPTTPGISIIIIGSETRGVYHDKQTRAIRRVNSARGWARATPPLPRGCRGR